MTQMNHDGQATLLTTYTDRLDHSQSQADGLLWQFGPLPLEMLTLFALARRLKQTLTPVATPEPFRTQLQQDLLASFEPAYDSDKERGRGPLWYSLAAVGSILPLLGLVVWRRRRRSHTLVAAAEDAAGWSRLWSLTQLSGE